MVTQVHFHPKSYLCSVTTSENIVRLFQIDENTNPLVDKIHLLSKQRLMNRGKKFKLHTTKFTYDGKELIATATDSDSFFFVDIVKGVQKKSPKLLGI